MSDDLCICTDSDITSCCICSWVLSVCAMLSLPVPISDMHKVVSRFAPSFVHQQSSTSLHGLQPPATSAAENSHNAKADIEQCEGIRNQAPHFRHPAHAAEHARA